VRNAAAGRDIDRAGVAGAPGPVDRAVGIEDTTGADRMSTSFGHPSRAATDSPLYYRPPPRRSRWLLILLPVLAIFIGFASIVWFAYVEGAPASAVGEPPLIKADARPIKLKPDDPGGQAIADRGELGEMLADQAPSGPERLLPPPEEPLVPPPEEAPAQPSASDLANAANSLESEVESETLPPLEGASSATTAATSEPRQPAQSGGSEAATAPRPTDEPSTGSAAAIGSLFESDQPPREAPVAADATAASGSPPPPPALETRPAGATRAASTSASSATAEQEAGPATSRERAATITPGSPDQLRRPAVARDEPEVAARPAPAAAAVNPAARPSPEASVNGPHYRIQLAAVRNESDARRAWDLFQLDLGDVLSGIEPIIERGETSNGVFYRVQLGPYASLTQAETLCEELKRRNASCFVLRR
jgi:hypothetical protein